MRDLDVRFHQEWLGLAQPVEGLVFSVPVLADAQIAPHVRRSLTDELREHVDHAPPLRGQADTPARAATEEAQRAPTLRSAQAFFADFLGYGEEPGALVPRDELPPGLTYFSPEGQQQLRPSFALADITADTADTTDGASTPPLLALVWDLADDVPASTESGVTPRDTAAALSLDKADTTTGAWSYTPTDKLERLLRHAGVPCGFVCNGPELRLVYAPAGETSAHLTFRVADMLEPAGRPILAALELLFHARRTFSAAPEHTFTGLLAESRKRQADVTKDLAEQVFQAVELLVQGFEAAAARDCTTDLDWLRAALEHTDPRTGEATDHLYGGVLSVVLRLVFLLYAEDTGLLPVEHPVFSAHLSVAGLYQDLLADAGAHPESMHHRFGAYGRLLSLFRAVYLGVQHGDLSLPPRRGRLFDPNAYPFLEGGLPEWTSPVQLAEARARVRPPSVDDGTLHRVLRRLVVFKGQRLSYRTLDVEQIGSVYESLMGFHVLRVSSDAVRLGKHGVWVELDTLRAQKAKDRAAFLKSECGLSAAQISKVDAALKLKDHSAALDELLALAPGNREQRPRHHAAPGRLVLQPGEERRRSGSHYTPRMLTEKVVRRTLEPVLACLGEAPRAEQILELKVCDPAMGSGAFLVEACRHLAEHVVAAWTRSGELPTVAQQHGDPLLHARRLVAQRCLYGVDKNPAAVELGKLSLWLVTLSRTLPFTFLDHCLQHGDSLVGLSLDQVRAFHWAPKQQLETCSALLSDALDQALEHRGEILALASRDDTASQREKARLLEYAELATARVRLVADVCVGAFFAEGKDRAREAERDRRLALVQRYLALGDATPGDAGSEADDADSAAYDHAATDEARDERQQLEAELQELAGRIRAQHAPFHWMIEFPEVFYQERPDPLAGGEENGAAFMEAFVGNPPFMGVAFITEKLGEGYVPWLQMIHPATTGKFDLAAHFFRRAATLLGEHGTMGLIATNTISQGDTRATGLRALVQRGWMLYDATNSMPWPGAAAVTVSVVHGARGAPAGHVEPALDGGAVEVINSRLRPRPERPDAGPLQRNRACAFQGSIVLGMGFTLTPDEREELVRGDPRNADRIQPYLGGQEVNTSPTQSFERYVINFERRTLEESEQWPDLIDRVRALVKPERDKVRRDAHRKRWWVYADHRPGLYDSLRDLDRCLVTARTRA